MEGLCSEYHLVVASNVEYFQSSSALHQRKKGLMRLLCKCSYKKPLAYFHALLFLGIFNKVEARQCPDRDQGGAIQCADVDPHSSY